MHLAFLSPTAPGHINPTLPLVTELVRRGHRVSFATGQRMAPVVRAAGADPIPLPGEVAHTPMTGDSFTAADLAALLEGVLENQRACLPLLKERFEQDRPDLVCADLLDSTGRLLASTLAVPEVALIPNFAGSSSSPLADTFTSGDFDFAHPRLLAVQQRMAEFARENGLNELPDPMTEVMADLNLVFIPRHFQPDAAGFDERFRFLGPSLERRERDARPWQPRDPSAPLLFVSLGTAFNNRPDFFRACIGAFAHTRWHVAMAIGEQVEPTALGEVPPNFEIRAHFPQLSVLRQATAFLTHCGMGSTMEALYFGTPIVGAPQFPEQQANARRVQELGLGTILDNHEPSALRATVDTVSEDDRLAANLADMREVLRQGGGAAAGADAIEEYLGPGTSPAG